MDDFLDKSVTKIRGNKMGLSNKELPKLGFLYLDYVLRFFDHSNFKGWPN